MPYLRPSIHSVSACEPRPSAASAAALHPRRAWSLDMISARSARKPATAAAKPPMATRTSARCFAQVSCSSRLFTPLFQRLAAEGGGWRAEGRRDRTTATGQASRSLASQSS